MPDETVEEVATNVGQRIAEIRRERGLTQQALSSAVQTTVQWVSRVENGEENLTLASLVKMANALEVRVGELFSAPKGGTRKARRGRPRSAN